MQDNYSKVLAKQISDKVNCMRLSQFPHGIGSKLNVSVEIYFLILN